LRYLEDAMAQRVSCCFALVVLSASVLAAQGVGPSERPDWAKGVRGWGEYRISETASNRPLENTRWERGMLVAQDGKDNIYVFSPSAGRVDVFAPNGDRRDSWVTPDWDLAKEVATAVSGFSCDRRGETFAFLNRGTVRVFDRKKVQAAFELPTFGTGIAFAKGELLIARVPIEFGRRAGTDPRMARKESLLMRVSFKGEVLSEALAPDKAEGADDLSLGLTQDLAMSADENEEVFWVADRHRLYRLRQVSPSGEVREEWTSDTHRAEVSFSGETPKEPPPGLLPEAAAGFKAITAKMTVRDIVVRRGVVFALLNRGVATDDQVLDVFFVGSEGPCWRIAIRAEGGGFFDQLAVTETGFWVFPVAPGASPRWVERAPDWLMQQSLAGSGTAAVAK